MGIIEPNMPVNGYYRFCTNQAQNEKEMEAENNQNKK